MNKWAGIGAGIGSAIVSLRFAYIQAIYQFFDIGELILAAISGAFIGSIIGAVLCGVIDIVKVGANSTDSFFLKGVIYVTYPLVLLSLVDAFFIRGTYVFFPILTLITDGSLDGTYYSCTDWIAADEGSYCAD